MADQPQPEHKALADLAHHDLLETVNRLLREGMDWRVVLAALGSATSDLVTTKAGLHAVPLWFRAQANFIQGQIDE